MKKKYITPMIAVFKTDTQALLANSSPKNAVRLVDKTTQSDQLRSDAAGNINDFLFGIKDGGGTPNAKDNWGYDGDLWED